MTVERDGSLTLRVPPRCDPVRAERFVAGSEVWLADKVRRREEHPPAHPVRAFREGESFFYLGREYRLLVDDLADHEAKASPGTVKLVAGRLVLSENLAKDPRTARRAVIGWYRRTGLRWAASRLQPWAARLGVPEPAVRVRDVGNRWGTYRQSTSDPGTMALHWAIFQLPSHLVDYVIAHELAHIKLSGHGPGYWKLLRTAMPECEERRAELDDLGRRLWLGDVVDGKP
ncbi:SprT family zinc-dependent metalloprotease [Streptomyces sp. AcE210]|uniref:M48 family metallopeptidase n=1 Tax=Streptomyces sp. AcE210 TaxID=2292703 RepID=UPI001F0C4E68|nr:SprT family zinc-dependent metalloprotease [Streptomyces sp. AcE210]